MASSKKTIGTIKMRIPGGKASAAPPVGSTLGQYGVNMMDFIQPFNDQTKDMKGVVTVHITIYDDRTMTWRVVNEATDEMIRAAAGIQKGSARAHEDKVATLTQAQLEEIAQSKMEFMNANDLEAAKKQVAGTARSMGVQIAE
jgi:large subunit ribosomal protein L11